LISSWSFLVQRPESHMPLNWNFPAKIGPKTGKQVTHTKTVLRTALVYD
jgi:hypothetical protein